jgi:hypothetical protein
MGPDIGLPAPDIVVYLDIDPREAAKRGEGTFGSEIYEKIAFQKEVKKEFELLKDMKWMQMDAMRPFLKIGAEVFRTVETLLASKRVQIGTLFKLARQEPDYSSCVDVSALSGVRVGAGSTFTVTGPITAIGRTIVLSGDE